MIQSSALDSLVEKERELHHQQQAHQSLEGGEQSCAVQHNDSVVITAPQHQTNVLEEEDDAEQRLARSRDRNREHARRTRLRKKQQLEALQSKVKELQEESRLLKQTIEECSIATILLELSHGDDGRSEEEDDELKGIEQVISKAVEEKTFFTVTGKRKRFVSDADCNPPPMKLRIKGKVTLIGGTSNKAQINWKTGVYLDENGDQKQLSSDELEELRRERNRMHAKMTRDRKKLFITSVEKTISDLEEHNKLMRDILAKQALRHSACVTPDLGPMKSNPDAIPAMMTAIAAASRTQDEKEQAKRRAPVVVG